VSLVLGPGVGAEACYLAEGAVRLHQEGREPRDLEAGAEAARVPLGFPLLAPVRIEALEATRLLHVERMALDTCLFWTQAAQPGARNGLGETAWIMHLACSPLFARLPPANVQRVLERMERVALAAGETVIRQGEPGTHYYVVQQGRCAVVREASGGQEMLLAELEAGATFGEEALVAETRRNATVRMASDGVLGRLTKSDFLELVKAPLLRSLTSAEVQRLPEYAELEWLDVRLPEEHRASGLRNSRNLPLDRLREAGAGLDRERRYLVYCDSGRRSAAGAFLLAQQGLDVIHLRGGLLGRGIAADHEEPAAESPLRTHYQVSRLKQALARADRELTQAIHHSVEVEVRDRARSGRQPGTEHGSDADEPFSAEAARARRALQETQQRRKELAMAVAVLEGDAARERAALEETQRAEQARADEALRDGEERLGREYRRTAEALAKVHGRRSRLEEQLARDERQRQSELDALVQRREALEREREELREQERQARAALGALQARRQKDLEGLARSEQAIREEGEARLRGLRTELEQRFADAMELAERFRREREAAGAAPAEAPAPEGEDTGTAPRPAEAPTTATEAPARQAAAPTDATRLDEAARGADRDLAAARKRYGEARARHDAVAARVAARADAGEDAGDLESELAGRAEELREAQDAAAAAEAAQARAEIERRLAGEGEGQGLEDSVRQRLAQELEDWMRTELADDEVDHAVTVRLQEDLVRVQVQAEAERRAEEEATARMLAEVRSQLGCDREAPDGGNM
jgi:rhodanese-related sulfurtransferase